MSEVAKPSGRSPGDVLALVENLIRGKLEARPTPKSHDPHVTIPLSKACDGKRSLSDVLKEYSEALARDSLIESFYGSIDSVRFKDGSVFSGRYQAALTSGRSELFVSVRLEAKESTEEWLTHPTACGQMIAHQLARYPSFASGLLLICGRTGVAKTHTARELIRRVLLKRQAHLLQGQALIAAEDPPELLSRSLRAAINRRDVPQLPREISGKCNLRTIFRDALRQRPCLVYVGELRGQKEIAQALEFGRTGHRMIATTHAGSVADCFEKLFLAAEAGDSEQRAHVATSLFGIVHLQAYHGVFGGHRVAISVPSCWLATPISRKLIANSGLASLVPRCSGRVKGESSYFMGQTEFVRTLLEEFAWPLLATRFKNTKRSQAKMRERFRHLRTHQRQVTDWLYRQVIQSDLF